jgi:hypothetical protein
MINKDRNCKNCAYLENTHCKKWASDIPNIHAFTCSSYSLKKEFKNKGLAIFERDTQELIFQYGEFKVVDKEYYPNYTMELYEEFDDSFVFKYYYILTNANLNMGLNDKGRNVLGHLSVGRKTTYVDKPRYQWDLIDGIEIHGEKLYARGNEDGEISISLERLKNIIELVESVESSGNPLNVPEGITVQYIKSEKYNTLTE